jgi:hypothetical protein
MLIVYTGTPNYNEFSLTGVSRLWTTGMTQDIPSAQALILQGSGSGFALAVTPNVRASYILDQRAVPVILPSSGTSNATGQITLTTALPYSPASLGVVQIYLPAGVVTSGTQGSGAGLYSAIFSSTTVCQLTGTVVTGNAAYTQVVTQVTLATVQVAGGLIGANGSVRANLRATVPNNANTKTTKIAFSGQLFCTASTTTFTGQNLQGQLYNRGSQAVNIVGTGPATASVASANYSIDTSITQPITLTGQLAVDTDYIILEGYTVEVLPG